jgi:hypothetical protein
MFPSQESFVLRVRLIVRYRQLAGSFLYGITGFLNANRGNSNDGDELVRSSFLSTPWTRVARDINPIPQP